MKLLSQTINIKWNKEKQRESKGPMKHYQEDQCMLYRNYRGEEIEKKGRSSFK